MVEVHRLRSVVTEGGGIESRCPRCDSASSRTASAVEPADDALDHMEAQPSWRRYALAGSVAVGLIVVIAAARSGVPATAAVAESFAPAAQASPASPRPLAQGIALSGAAGPDDPGDPGEPGDSDDELDHVEEELFDEDLEEIAAWDEELPPTIEDLREDNGEPLEERLPTLLDWVFPVVPSDEDFPLRRSRRFGAARDGVSRIDCGRGHCGVDLDGERGTPVVAVAWGEVVRIERRENRRSGMYVRIQHPDYVYTSYMHLDSIAEGLRIGDEVQPGEVVGTLGRTGILRSAAHLHFSLEVPMGRELKHIDPVPYLRDAARLPEPTQGND